MQILSVFLILNTCLLATNQGFVESLTLFPRFQCLVRFAVLRFDIMNFDKYPTYFRNNSQAILAESGSYIGEDSIKEYVEFGSDKSPYFSRADIAKTSIRFRGYNKETGQCEFLALYKLSRTTRPEVTIGEISYQAAIMVKLFYDLSEHYITGIHFFYPYDYIIKAFFGYIVNSPKTREYICSVMSGACAGMIDATNDCVGNLAAITAIDTNGQVVGNSQGCRALHAAFAATNSHHCPHLSFTPMADYNGKIKCQSNGDITPNSLFEPEEFEIYGRFATRMGFDPKIGHNIVVPAM